MSHRRITNAKDYRILIVDDLPQNLKVLGGILMEIGFKVSIAGSGADALVIAETSKPDLVLLDLMMPEMDGVETCTLLNKIPEVISCPVIFLTAHKEMNSIQNAFEAGAVDYITKPFIKEELLARIWTQLQIQDKQRIIERKNTELNEFIHLLCHDLLNPIASAQSIREILKSEPGKQERLEKHLDLNLQNAISMVQNIRTNVSLDEGKETLDLQSHNLDEMIQESISMVNFLTTKKNIFICSNVEKSTYVVVDRISFVGSVINNLLTNAIKFSNEGKMVEINSTDEGEHVTLEVRDYGIGIPDDMLPTLFDMAKSGSRRGTAGETGTGYGMPLVNKYVQAYGGDISIESTESEKSNFNSGTSIRLKLQKN